MPRFMIVTDSGKVTATDRNVITTYLSSKGWAWWHHFLDVWLVQADAEDVTADTIFGDLDRLVAPGRRAFIVINADDTTHLRGRTNPRAWNWLRRRWERQSNLTAGT